IWAGVMPMAIIGASRAFGVDITPYLSAYGLKVYNKMKKASIAEVLGAYPGLTWKQLAKPQYPTPESVDVYVEIVNQLIMSAGGSPTTPMFIAQGAKGELEGTPGNKPGIGPGDGVMIAGDVRSLARAYCADGTDVTYRQYNNASHVGAMLHFLPSATTWLRQRFAGVPAPENCGSIAPGNSLAPVVAEGALSLQ
ncbi:MAG: triacylglycerol lipase, partial [Solirubrobacteraceae bacterium]|nr:triacylglycerol lipase [Solirubrobacteraceae bacterium]